MATYVPGSKSYMPEFKPFTPDYKFLSTVLDTKTNRYNTNYKQLNDLYSKIVYAPLSREDTQFMRDQYTEGLSDKLEKISGMDLSLDELSEVGDTVGEFASESATIVVGAVIDPEMSDDLKVTVVATGLGEMQKNNLKLHPVRENGRRRAAKKVDYDQPTVFRNKETERCKNSKSVSTTMKKPAKSNVKKVTKTSKSMTTKRKSMKITR